MFTSPGAKATSLPEQARPDTGPSIEQRFSELKELIENSDQCPELGTMSDNEVHFRNSLMDNIREGAIFVDTAGVITSWNRGAELITGLSRANMVGAELTADLLGLQQADGDAIEPQKCPIRSSITELKKTVAEFGLVGRSGREVQIELTVVPVIRSRKCLGAVVLLLDLSANADLKQQLSDLYNASVLDPLTHVANRAEFEKHLRDYVKAHRAAQSKCCIIVADIDYFKQVNDTYGHHIGDQALIAFASALKKFVRSRDIVARYGGEEFVILCANCDIDSAVERAEQIRMNLNRTPQQMLNGKTISASFGVSELMEEEDVTSFFVRADKALYNAKQSGRNCVMRAGDESPQEESLEPNIEKSSATGICWRKPEAGFLYCEEFRTTTPSSLLASKIRGYISEVDAAVRECEAEYTSLTVLGVDPENAARKTHFRVDLEIRESDEKTPNGSPVNYLRVTVYPPRQRLFRRIHEDLHARVVSEMRRFLMLSDESACVRLNPAATTSGREERESAG